MCLDRSWRLRHTPVQERDAIGGADSAWVKRQQCCRSHGQRWCRPWRPRTPPPRHAGCRCGPSPISKHRGRRRLPDPYEHADVGTTGKWGYRQRGDDPSRTKGPAANLEKRKVDSPDCQDAGPRNLILHDQPESRRSHIGHQCHHSRCRSEPRSLRRREDSRSAGWEFA